MLIGIPKILSPDLLKILMEMGHGDEIVLADGNFPSSSHGNRLIRADGHGVVPLLEGILTLFPLDNYVEHPVMLMKVVEGDKVTTPIWNDYDRIIKGRTCLSNPFLYVERFAFYERAKQAYAVVATGETALYANVILKKGIIQER